MESFFSRISGALKRGGNNDDRSNVVTQSAEKDESRADEMNTISNVHPNMSMFDAIDNSAQTSVPHYATMKRGSKPSSSKVEEDVPSSNAHKRSLRLPKKLLYPLHLGHGGPNASASVNDTNANAEGEPSTPSVPATTGSRFSSLRSALRNRDDNKDKEVLNTPTTGRSVRFFSRDSTKPTSVAEASPLSGHDLDQTVFESMLGDEDNSALAASSPTITRQRKSVRDVFPDDREASTSSPLANRTSGVSFSPVPPPELSNIFDLPAEQQPPAIPMSDGLNNSATETDDAHESPSDEATVQRRDMQNKNTSSLTLPVTQSSAESKPQNHDRTRSFSFGQTVFFSAARSSSGGSDPNASNASATGASYELPKPLNLTRAQNETIFKPATDSPTSPSEPNSASALPARMSQYLSGLLPSRAPSRLSARSIQGSEALSNGDHPGPDGRESSQVQIWSPPQPDPFAADARTYFGPETHIPQTPPDTARDVYFPLPDVGAIEPSRSGAQSRASSFIDVNASTVANLRAQVALQDEMKRQFELDLAARDELVIALREKLATANSDAEVRKAAMRGWKKKVQELERACRYLEEEVDRSARSEVERSVLEEASAGALRMLHERITVLEKEKAEAERSYEALQDDMERQQRSGSSGSNLVEGAENTNSKDQQSTSTNLREDERKTLEANIKHLESELTQAREDCAAFRSEAEDRAAHLHACNEELQLLRSELEAQWRGTEQSGEKLNLLRRECDQAQARCTELENEVRQLEEDAKLLKKRCEEAEKAKAELEASEQEAWAAKEEAERERDELELQVQDGQHQNADELAIALQEREDRIVELQDEASYARNTIARLEGNIRERDSEAAEYVQRLRASEEAAEDLRQQLSKSAREHRRMAEEHRRELEEVRQSGGAAQSQMQQLIRTKAEADVRQTQLQERTTTLEAELDKLRRQVHEMQQESAKKDLHIAQLSKQRARDKEDIQGLNIALDSKQQELELVKRRQEKQSSRSTSVAIKGATSRRVSSSTTARLVIKPSLGSRPPSVMSASSTRESDVESVSVVRAPILPRRVVSGSGETMDSDAESVDTGRAPIVTRVSRSGSTTTSTLTKGTRANSLASSAASTASSNVSSNATATAKKINRMSIAGSIGPPPASASVLRPRMASSSATPSETVSARLSAVKATPTMTPISRRASSALSTRSGVESEDELRSPTSEKENAPTPRAYRPVPAA